MTDQEEQWRERVKEWRESGLTSKQFSEGRGFRAGLLRNWAFRLGECKPRKRRTPGVQFARVLRTPAMSPAQEATAVVVEIGRARVVVRSGFDRVTLMAVLEMLERAGAR